MKRQGPDLRPLALLSQVGLNVFIPILGGILIGAWLDKKLASANFFLIVLTILGVAAGLFNIIKLGRRL